LARAIRKGGEQAAAGNDGLAISGRRAIAHSLRFPLTTPIAEPSSPTRSMRMRRGPPGPVAPTTAFPVPPPSPAWTGPNDASTAQYDKPHRPQHAPGHPSSRTASPVGAQRPRCIPVTARWKRLDIPPPRAGCGRVERAYGGRGRRIEWFQGSPRTKSLSTLRHLSNRPAPDTLRTGPYALPSKGPRTPRRVAPPRINGPLAPISDLYAGVRP